MDSIGDWRRFIATTRARLKQRRVPQDLSPEWIERQLQPIRCSPNYPDLAAHDVLLARELCMVGSLLRAVYDVGSVLCGGLRSCTEGAIPRFSDVPVQANA